jgi:hypothetical protein
LHKFPYEVELVGDYHGVGAFINAIESHNAFMQLERAELTGAKGDDGRAVHVKILLSLYGGGDGWTDRGPASPGSPTPDAKPPARTAPSKPKSSTKESPRRPATPKSAPAGK